MLSLGAEPGNGLDPRNKAEILRLGLQSRLISKAGSHVNSELDKQGYTTVPYLITNFWQGSSPGMGATTTNHESRHNRLRPERGTTRDISKIDF